MLRSLKDLELYTVSATDGEVGRVVDFLLDDQRWLVRFLVVEIGGAQLGRRVLISPQSFLQTEWSTRQFRLSLTMEKVKCSPPVDLEQPVSRKEEWEFLHYYGYPNYWATDSGGGSAGSLVGAADSTAGAGESPGEIHVRGASELRGYYIQACDAAIGHVEDVVIDDESWSVRFLVVDTSTWALGRSVLVAPAWARKISWEERKVYLDMSRGDIQASPEWSATAAINRDYALRLHDYLERPVPLNNNSLQAGATTPPLDLEGRPTFPEVRV